MDRATIEEPDVLKEEKGEKKEDHQEALEERETALDPKPKEETKSSSSPGTTAVKRREDDPNYKENDPASYTLTKEMAIAAATDNFGTRGAVVVTWANYHYKDFVMNWVEHLQETGCKTFLVGKNKKTSSFFLSFFKKIKFLLSLGFNHRIHSSSHIFFSLCYRCYG